MSSYLSDNTLKSLLLETVLLLKCLDLELKVFNDTVIQRLYKTKNFAVKSNYDKLMSNLLLPLGPQNSGRC